MAGRRWRIGLRMGSEYRRGMTSAAQQTATPRNVTPAVVVSAAVGSTPSSSSFIHTGHGDRRYNMLARGADRSRLTPCPYATPTPQDQQHHRGPLMSDAGTGGGAHRSTFGRGRGSWSAARSCAITRIGSAAPSGGAGAWIHNGGDDARVHRSRAVSFLEAKSKLQR